MGRITKKKRPPIIFEAVKDEAGCNSAHSVLWMWRVWRENAETTLSLDIVWAVTDAIGIGPGVLDPRIYVHWDCGTEEYVICCIVRTKEDGPQEGQETKEVETGISNNVTQTRDWLRDRAQGCESYGAIPNGVPG